MAPSVGEVMLGAAGAVTRDLDDGVNAARRLELPSARAYCVVLVDGLGWHNLHGRADDAPFLTRSVDRLTLGTCALPSTTATNLSYLGTGMLPGATGMVGYSARNPGTGQVMNLISFAGGPDPLQWQQRPTVFERLTARGHTCVSVGTWRFENSPLTLAAMRGSEYEAAETLPQRVDIALEVLSEPVSLVYLYWPQVDSVGHAQGWGSQAWRDELRHTDEQLARLARNLPSDTAMIVTADHGMVDIPLEASTEFEGPARIDLAGHADLAADVDLVAGEPRFSHLYTHRPRAVQERWQSALGPRATVIRRSEAISHGWFGAVAPQVEDALGDVMVAAAGDICIVDSRSQSSQLRSLRGMHGSTSALETEIPIAVVGG